MLDRQPSVSAVGSQCSHWHRSIWAQMGKLGDVSYKKESFKVLNPLPLASIFLLNLKLWRLSSSPLLKPTYLGLQQTATHLLRRSLMPLSYLSLIICSFSSLFRPLLDPLFKVNLSLF